MKPFKQTGFTLIELLVVISIISLLSSVVMTGLGSAKMKARDAERMQEILQIRTALELYRSENSGYPAGGGDMGDPNQAYSTDPRTWTEPANFPSSLKSYLAKLPLDPTPKDLGNFVQGSYFYWYHRSEKNADGYILCTALEVKKGSNNPVVTPISHFYSDYSVYGGSNGMFNGGFCVSSF